MGCGWIASIIAFIGILKSIQIAFTVFGLIPVTWQDFEQGIRAENLGLPIQIEEGLSLTKMSTNWKDKSITYHYRFNYQTLNKKTFDLQNAKQINLENCSSYKDILGYPAKKIINEYEANDGTIAIIEILPEDCGF